MVLLQYFVVYAPNAATRYKHPMVALLYINTRSLNCNQVVDTHQVGAVLDWPTHIHAAN